MACLLFAGCTQDPELVGRNNVKGTITIDQQPMPAGDINFVQMPEATKPGGGAKISNGKFEMTGRGGLHAGKYKVVFRSTIYVDPVTGKEPGPDFEGEKMDLKMVDLLPEKFNETNEIYFEVVDKQTNVFDYDIKTK